MKKPLVSTITPCFRMKRYLKKFLEDLPSQTMFDRLEVVLDHNEPDEEEVEWVREFEKKYPGKIKHIIVEKVEPIGVSMNRCIREASADILTIWNVDDLRTPDSIECQYKKITQKEDTDLVYGNFLIVKTFGEKEGYFVDSSRFKRDEFVRSMVFGPYFMFKKRLCDIAGYFDEQLRSGADFDFAIRLAYHTNPVIADCLLGYYLNEGLGASTRPDSLQAVERTVIELRYAIYDKLDYDLVVKATQYDILRLFFNNQSFSVKDFVPRYDDMVKENQSALIERGVNKYLWKKIFGVKKIKKFFKKILK